MSSLLINAEAYIFDFNGTLILDEKENREAWKEAVFQMRGKPQTDDEFALLNGRTDRETILYYFPQAEDDEIIKSVLIPEKEFTHLFYRKIGTRRANAISKLSLSAAAVVRDGIIEDFRASSGAAGPKVIRSREAESLLTKRQISEIPEIADDFIAAWDRAISPHAMPVYRRNTTSRMLLHFLEALQDEERSGIIE